MLRLNAFLLVGGLAAFVAGSAAGFKVLTVSDNKAQHSPAIITSAEAAPRPAPVTPPRAEEPDSPPPVSTKAEKSTAPAPPPPPAAPTRIAEAKSERSDAGEPTPAPAASSKKAQPGKSGRQLPAPKRRSRDDDDDDDC